MMLIPPFTAVRLVEYRDHIELTPVQAYRDFVGLGRFKVDAVRPFPAGEVPFFDYSMGNKEIWVVVNWRVYEDGSEEAVNMEYLHQMATEQEARKAFERWDEFSKTDAREGGIQNSRDQKRVEQYDLYQARLKALAGIQPKTVALLEQAFATEEPEARQRLEWEAVQAYFAELALYWTEDAVIAWQQSNPVGTKWLLEFSRVLQQPKRDLDPINHELALNWLRRGYNLCTAEELSEKIRAATGRQLTPQAIKKRRERLGLTTKRPPGPPPRKSTV